MERKVTLRGDGVTAGPPTMGTRDKELGIFTTKGKIKRKCAKLGIKMGDADASLFLESGTATT